MGNEVGLDLKLTSEEIIAEIQGLKPLLPIVATIANPILPPKESGMCGVTKLCVFRHINLRSVFILLLLEMAMKSYDISSSHALFLFFRRT